jgi:hypothetical protein
MQWYSALLATTVQVDRNAKDAKSKSTPFDSTTVDNPIKQLRVD